MFQTIYVVIGASRGIGQGIVKELSKDPSNQVIATTRKPVDFEQPNVTNLILDQNDSESVKAAATQVKEADVLLVNAAIGEQEYLLETTIERLQQYLDTNVVGVHRVVDAFLPALRARETRKIILTSSSSGSMGYQKDVFFAFQGPYSVTKAANNMQAVQYHNELRKEGFTVIPLHPGWVATDMGNAVIGKEQSEMQPISVEESVSAMTKLIKGLRREDSGVFFSYDGTNIPW